MEKEYTYSEDSSVKDFEEFLCSMSFAEKIQYEIVFSAKMIESICTEKKYPCYKFAHNLEDEPYIRAKVNQITLEFLVRNIPERPGEKESLILQIKKNGQRVYDRPKKPIGTIYVI